MAQANWMEEIDSIIMQRTQSVDNIFDDLKKAVASAPASANLNFMFKQIDSAHKR